MNLWKKLTFRVVAPILLLATVFWLMLALVVIDTIGFFARERAEEELKSFSREIFGICNRYFQDLAIQGKLDDPVAERVQKAMTLGDVEDFLGKFRLEGMIYRGEATDRTLLMETDRAGSLASGWSAGFPQANVLMSHAVAGKRYFSYAFDFQPWGWRIVLVRDLEAYAELTSRVRRLYWILGALLLMTTVGVIILENRLLSKPVAEIIRKLSNREPPTYQGIGELEFLSSSIAEMMQTLAERETRLRESESRYRTIFETTGTAVAVCESDTILAMVNTRFEQDTGFSKQELEGIKSWTEFVSANDLDRIKRLVVSSDSTASGVPIQCELTWMDRAGIRKHMLLSAASIPGSSQSIISLIDITDRRREELERQLLQEARAADTLRRTNAELSQEIETRKAIQESLRASEERFRAVFETAEDSIFIKNTQFKYTHVNPAYASLLERPLQDILGRTDEGLSLDPDYATHAKRLEKRVLRGETFETEHAVSWKGWPVFLNVIRFPLRNSSGVIFGICGIARDVSDRKIKPHQGLIPTVEGSRSPVMRETMRQVLLAAESNSTVLFLGESGTGKDHWARFLHDHSRRALGSFFSINCAALSPELVESELFGHEAGAFTGSRGRKRGLLELSEGGSLLLNEIGEMPLSMQSKLLTFLDTQSITRVGGETSISVDTRILAATNRDLPAEVERGHFRQDLYYRLAVFTITVPPLRERPEDIPNLVMELLARIGERMGISRLPAMDSLAMESLQHYDWPGNVRELQNVLERALILCDGKRITSRDIGIKTFAAPDSPLANAAPLDAVLSHHLSFEEAVAETKRHLILRALDSTGGSIKEAAELLGMTRNSIDHHIRRLGIRKREPSDLTE